MKKKGLMRKWLLISLTSLMMIRPFSVLAEDTGPQETEEPQTAEVTEQESVPEETEEIIVPEDTDEEPAEEMMPEETAEETVLPEMSEAEEAETAEEQTEEPAETALPEEETETEEPVDSEVTVVNDVYEGLIEEEDLRFPVSSGRRKLKAASLTQTQEYTDIAAVGAKLREDIKVRNQGIALQLNIPLQYDDTSQFDVTGFANQAFDRLTREIMAEAMLYSDVSNEGDYIKYQYGGYKFSPGADLKARKNKTTGVVTIVGAVTVTFSYYSDALQETETRELIGSALSELALDSLPDIEKIRRIYQYICQNVSYDYENLPNEDYNLKYTAYAAIHDHTAVCQGYAALFYRMAHEAGLEARIVSGKGGGEMHAWNIVKLNDQWYLLDTTWDAGTGDPAEWSWFLKSSASFRNHQTGSDDYNQNVISVCPITETDYVPLQGIELPFSETELVIGEDQPGFDVTFLPESATVKDVRMEISDPDVLGFENGSLVIRDFGTTQLVFTSHDGNYQAVMNVRVCCVPGLIETSDGYRWRQKYGDFLVSKWKTIDGSWHYFNQDGYMISGWLSYKNNWYYLNDGGDMAVGWKEISDKWYWFSPSGVMKTGWLKDHGKWYWLSGSGAMATGWKKLSWAKGTDWFWFSPYGVMKTGWLKYKNNWYHLNDGGVMDTGWKKISGYWYYMDASGVMASDTWIGKYHVNSSGKWDRTR